MSRIRQARRRAGLSQEELAQAAGVSPATVVQVELGQRQPQGRTLRKLAAALGVEVAELVEEEVAAVPKTSPRLDVTELPGLDAALKRHGMSLSQLAFRAGMTPGEVIDYEIGARKPSEEVVNRIADALGAKIFELTYPPAEQLEVALAEDEQTSQWATEQRLAMSAQEVREELLKNPAARRIRDAHAKEDTERQAERKHTDNTA